MTQPLTVNPTEVLANYFGTDKKGVANFEPQTLNGDRYLVGRVKQGTPKRLTYTPCFYVDGDLGREAYKALCRTVRQLGHQGKFHVFVRGFEILQSPNVMFHRVSKDGTKVLDI